MPEEGKNQCDICGFMAKTAQGLAGHRQFKHSLESPSHTDETGGLPVSDLALEHYLEQHMDELIHKLGQASNDDPIVLSDQQLITLMIRRVIPKMKADLELLFSKGAQWEHRLAAAEHAIEAMSEQLKRLEVRLKAVEHATESTSEQLKRLNEHTG